MYQRISAVVVGMLVLACIGCKNDSRPRGAAPKGTTTAEAPPQQPDPILLELPLSPKPTKGPVLTPVVTSTLTFVVPAEPVTWAEVSFPCYAAGIGLQGTGVRPGMPLESASPQIPAFMKAAGIDLDRDIAAMGGFDCGQSPCLYVAMQLRDPSRLESAFASASSVVVKRRGEGHFSFVAPGVQGPREVHVRVVPITWAGGSLSDDKWNHWQARATHVLFLTGVTGGPDVDPMSRMASGEVARAKVAELETLGTDPRGRCLIGRAGPSAEFRPGFQLESARFLVSLPEGTPDALTRNFGSKRTFDAEVELTLTPTPTEADLARWIGEAKDWANEIVPTVSASDPKAGKRVAALTAIARLVVDRGFTTSRKDKVLRMSLRTNRIPAKELTAIDVLFAEAFGTPASQ